MSPRACRSDSATLSCSRTRRAPGQPLAYHSKCLRMQTAPIDELAKRLLASSGDAPVHLEAPDAILYNTTEQPDRKRTLVHLLNYTLDPVENLQMKVKGSYRAARLISPDAAASFASAPTFSTGEVDLRIPQLRIYSVVVLDWK